MNDWITRFFAAFFETDEFQLFVDSIRVWLWVISQMDAHIPCQVSVEIFR